MRWHVLAGWAYGFFAPAIIGGLIAASIAAIGLVIVAQDTYRLSSTNVWSAVGVFAAVAIVAIVVGANVIK